MYQLTSLPIGQGTLGRVDGSLLLSVILTLCSCFIQFCASKVNLCILVGFNAPWNVFHLLNLEQKNWVLLIFVIISDMRVLITAEKVRATRIIFFCNVTAFIYHMTTNVTETTLFSFKNFFSVINDTSFGKKEYNPG